MGKIDENSLVGRWKEIMTEHNGKTKLSENSYSTYTFQKDGRMLFELLMDNKRITDGIDRHWILNRAGANPVIQITNESTDYEIISLDKKKLILRNSSNEIIYHFEKEW